MKMHSSGAKTTPDLDSFRSTAIQGVALVKILLVGLCLGWHGHLMVLYKNTYIRD